MIGQLFKKKQEPYLQFCNCSLTSAGGTQGPKGEKFLARLQTQSAKVSLQVNTSVKTIGHKKEKQSKHSLRPKEKKRQNIYTIVEKGFSTANGAERQIYPSYTHYQPMVWNHYQTTADTRRNGNQRNQLTYLRQIHPRKAQNQIKIDRNYESHEKKPMTQRSTSFSNATQVKNSIQMPQTKTNNQYVGNNNTTISSIQHKEMEEVNCIPRSKSFSANIPRKSSVVDKLNVMIEKKENVHINNIHVQQSNPISMLTTVKLTDLMFKSTESFQEGASDQYSELASENQSNVNSFIKQSGWSQSLNQIFVKKLRRMSHNTNI